MKESVKRRFILLTTYENGFVKLFHDEITFIRYGYKRSYVYLRNGKSIEVKNSADEINENLNGDFYRVHSYLSINMGAVRQARNNDLYFEGGGKCHMGKNNYAGTKRAIMEYYSKGARE